MSSFSSLDLNPRMLETLDAEGYEIPTPIQAQSIPPVLEGRDLLGCAQTGTGKTAAFCLPLIENLSEGGRRGFKQARALILAPTRELAAQIEDSLRTYGRHTKLRHVVIYGGVKQYHQVRQLRAGVDVIVATPGRLLDLMQQGYIDLRAIEMFVLDEADRMLDMGFIDPIRRIARELPEDRQTLLFSATMPPKIRELADAMLHEPVSVAVSPDTAAAPLIDQTLYHIPSEKKPDLLRVLLEDGGVARAVVFTKTKHGAEKLAKRLSRDGVAAGAIHGNKTQAQRQRALDAFRDGRSRVLVATDVAARGLDVDGITHVFNYNLPMEPEAYIHRIGRTGRAGATGHAISFCARDERNLLRSIERMIGERIETTPVPEEFGVPAPTLNVERERRSETRDRPSYTPRRKSSSRRVAPNTAKRVPRSAARESAKPGAKASPSSDSPRQSARSTAKNSRRKADSETAFHPKPKKKTTRKSKPNAKPLVKKAAASSAKTGSKSRSKAQGKSPKKANSRRARAAARRAQAGS